jgi:hypothetical protein
MHIDRSVLLALLAGRITKTALIGAAYPSLV